ncbi:hypothetical protein EC988_006254, partial [Linderina pennispora]
DEEGEDDDDDDDDEEPVTGQKRKQTQSRFQEPAEKKSLVTLDQRQPGEKTRALFKCSICLDKPDPAVYLKPCGHVFCEGCALASGVD